MKQNKQQSIWKRLAKSKKRLVILGVAMLFVLGQLAFDAYALIRLSMMPSDTILTDRMIDSIENISKPGIVDPVNKKVYMPEANIVLPFYPTNVSSIRYGYNAVADGTGASLQITSTEAVHRAANDAYNAGSAYPTLLYLNDGKRLERLFDEVPRLQACARGYEVVFGNDQPEFASAEQIDARTLADGRRIAIYQEKGCAWQPDGMTEYVKQLQSY